MKNIFSGIHLGRLQSCGGQLCDEGSITKASITKGDLDVFDGRDAWEYDFVGEIVVWIMEEGRHMI